MISNLFIQIIIKECLENICLHKLHVSLSLDPTPTLAVSCAPDKPTPRTFITDSARRTGQMKSVTGVKRVLHLLNYECCYIKAEN